MNLTHRERVRLALNHEETDRVPIAMVCSGINPPAYQALTAHLKRERELSVEAYLRPLLDIRSVAPAYVGPPLPPGTDIWGVRRVPVSYGAGEYDEIEYYPLAEAASPADLRRHRWPTTDWFDYSVMSERIAAIGRDGDYCLMVENGNIFETSWYMRGFERMFTDLVLNPELARAIFQRVSDFFAEHFRRVLEAACGRIDLVFTADDIGGQEGLLMSLKMWEQHIKPFHSRLNHVIHGYGAKVIYHTDGSVMPAVPGLIDMGVDILQALQFDARGMDPMLLKEQFGRRLCFQGGVSVQRTLPFGTVEDVRREVDERIRVLGRNGGYILGPSHVIQAGTPPENIVAMFDTAAARSSTRY
ncbi:MAG TPA: uroporphyrinogen decarboxylase family protein [Opitutaceae bacterium]|nr:uroporphyrinogen decarboxylase family protein [Opitutaceae bacterium]